jgi:hypothetical protein
LGRGVPSAQAGVTVLAPTATKATAANKDFLKFDFILAPPALLLW